MNVDSVDAFFEQLEERIDPEGVQGIDATFLFDLDGEQGGQWSVVLQGGKPTVSKSAVENPDITIIATAENWLKIVNGELSGQAAFLTGKIRLRGDMALAMKLQNILG